MRREVTSYALEEDFGSEVALSLLFIGCLIDKDDHISHPYFLTEAIQVLQQADK